jgi:hypothetical protein
MVNVWVLLHPPALVYVAIYESVPTVNGMLLIWRAVDVYLLGPVQFHDPPLIGCGPRSTTVDGEFTVALDSSVQVEPPLIEMYGVMLVGVQLTVKAMVVLAVRLPEAPLTVIVAEPTVAELLAVRVSTLLPVVGLVAKAALTPLGRPDAASVTLPVKPFRPVTVMVDFPEAPRAMLRVAGEAPSVKLGAGLTFNNTLLVAVA